MPPGVLYRVKATYGYVKEDVDELSFEVGDIIRVIEYDDPEDQVKKFHFENFFVNSQLEIILTSCVIIIKIHVKKVSGSRM